MRTSDRFRFWLAALVALGLVLAGGAVALADVDMYVNNAGGGHPNYPTLAAALDAADKTAYAGVAVTITIRSTGDGDGAGRVVNKDTTVLIETSVAGPITVGGNAGRIRGSDGAAVVITGANTGTVNNPNGSVSLQGNSSGDVTGLTITLSAGNASTSVSGTLTSTAGGSIVAANDVYIADCTISSLTSGNVYTSGNVTVTGNTSAVVSVESGTLSVPGGLGGTVRVKDGATLDATNHTGNTMTLEAYTGSTVLNLYMLTLDGMGGVVNPAILVTGMGVSGDGRLAFGPLPTPDRPGAAFLGWDVGGTLYQPGDSVVMNGNTTAYAQWDVGGPQLVSLTVANQSATIDDAAKTASVTVPYGTDLASLFVSAQAALGQSIFEGPAFTADASGGTFTVTVVDAGNVQHPYTVAVTVGNPSGDTSLTAFSLDSHAGTISGNAVTVVLPYGTDLTSLSAGWTTADPFAMVTPDPAGVLDWSSPVRLTVTASGGATVTYTVTAREDVAPGLYTLTLNANGGSVLGLPSYTFPAQTALTFDLSSAGIPTHPQGLAFLGWLDAGGTPHSGSYTAAASGETLTALWDVAPGFYTLTLNANGGSILGLPSYAFPAQTTLTFDLSSAGTPTHPQGLAFLGWLDAGGTPHSGSYTAAASGETLTALWDVAPGFYTLMLDANGGSVLGLPSYTFPAQTTLTFDLSSAGLPTHPQELAFLGWLDAGGTLHSGSYTAAASGETLTAAWDSAPQPTLYTLTLNANGGLDAWQNAYTYPAQASPTFDLASAGTPSHPLGYAFLGWQNTAGQLYVGGYTATAASETLIAAWDIPGRYVGGDGSGVSPTEAAASSGGHRIVGCKEWVNVRSGPGTNYEVVGRAFLGETVEPIQEKDGWVDCYYNGRSAHGWIRADFVD